MFTNTTKIILFIPIILLSPVALTYDDGELNAALRAATSKITADSKLCHPAQSIAVNHLSSNNLFIGTGLWSHLHGLSQGVPYRFSYYGSYGSSYPKFFSAPQTS